MDVNAPREQCNGQPRHPADAPLLDFHSYFGDTLAYRDWQREFGHLAHVRFGGAEATGVPDGLHLFQITATHVEPTPRGAATCIRFILCGVGGVAHGVEVLREIILTARSLPFVQRELVRVGVPPEFASRPNADELKPLRYTYVTANVMTDTRSQRRVELCGLAAPPADTWSWDPGVPKGPSPPRPMEQASFAPLGGALADSIDRLVFWTRLYVSAPSVRRFQPFDGEEYLAFSAVERLEPVLADCYLHFERMPITDRVFYDWWQENPVFWVVPCGTVSGNAMGYVVRGIDKHSYRMVKDPDAPQLLYGFQDFGGFVTGNPIVLCEGVKDAIYVKKMYPYTLALLGCGLMDNAVEILRRLTTRVVLALDNDSGGAKGGPGVAGAVGPRGIRGLKRNPPTPPERLGPRILHGRHETGRGRPDEGLRKLPQTRHGTRALPSAQDLRSEKHRPAGIRGARIPHLDVIGRLAPRQHPLPLSPRFLAVGARLSGGRERSRGPLLLLGAQALYLGRLRVPGLGRTP